MSANEGKFVEKFRDQKVNSWPEKKLDAEDGNEAMGLEKIEPFGKRLQPVEEADGQTPGPSLKTPADPYNICLSLGSLNLSSELLMTSDDEFDFETATTSSMSSRALSSSHVSVDVSFKEKRRMPRNHKNMELGCSSDSIPSSAFGFEQRAAQGSKLQDWMKPLRKWRIPAHAAEQSSSEDDVFNERKAETDYSTSCSSLTVASVSQESGDNAPKNETTTDSSTDASPGPKEVSENSNKECLQPSTSAENDLDDEYADWDPRANFFHSTLNINCSDAQTTLKGVPHFKGAICPFSNSQQTCYKGERCRCEHHIDREKLAANPKLAIPLEPQPINHFCMLPPKIEGQCGSCFFAKVTCVNSIHDFFIVPVNGVYCECKKYDQDYIKRLGSKVYTLENITKELGSYFLGHSAKYSSSYGFLELALVRVNYNNEMGYYRVAILEDTPITSDELPEVRCFLLDLGHTVIVNFGQLQTLPKKFSNVPPLAYRCTLHGVTSTQLWGDSPADGFLRDTVDGKEVLVKIRQKCLLGDATAYHHTEQIPYGVELYVKDSCDRYVPLSDQLVQRCDVFRWGKTSLGLCTDQETESESENENCYEEDVCEEGVCGEDVCDHESLDFFFDDHDGKHDESTTTHQL